MLAKKTSKNQLTLPKRIIEQLPEADYFEVSLRRGEVVLRPIVMKRAGEELEAVRGKMRKLGLSEKDVGRAIQWARSARK
jgi:hypothetical protein